MTNLLSFSGLPAAALPAVALPAAALPLAAGSSPSSVAADYALAVLSVALVLCFVRLALGPSLPDRVVALDLIATLIAGMLVLHSVAESEPNSLRVALVLALINFLATVGFALYVGRKVTP